MSKQHYHTIAHLVERGLLTATAAADLTSVTDMFAVGVTEHVAQTMNSPEDPIARQFIPAPAEAEIKSFELTDPIADQKFSPLPGIVHRYPDRCLLMPIRVCATYCRFCFRKKLIGPGHPSLSPREREQALDYIAEHPEIWEVIFSGGDPLLLSARQLAPLITRLNTMEHIGLIRFHSRIPVVAPERLTDEVLNVLQRSEKPIFLALHANHAQEFTPEVRAICRRLHQHGVTLVSQSVLLRGINDSVPALEALFKTFLQNRIKPYYLHQCDLVPGTSHLRVPIAEGQALLARLRGKISGLCLPSYMLDIPGGYGKVPIGPNYLESTSEGYLVTDSDGATHHYAVDAAPMA